MQNVGRVAVQALLICCVSTFGVTTSFAQTHTAVLTVAGPANYYSPVNPVPPGARVITPYFFSLSGLEQIPDNATIVSVRMYAQEGSFFDETTPAQVAGEAEAMYAVNGVTCDLDSANYCPTSEPRRTLNGAMQNYGSWGTFVQDWNYMPDGVPRKFTKNDLATYQWGYWTVFDNGCCTFARDSGYVSFQTTYLEVVYDALTITGPDEVWSFNNQNPSGYSTSIVLASSGGTSTTWSVPAGANKVNLSTTQGSQVTVTSSGTAFSSFVGDVVIRASAGGATADKALTTRTPYSLQPGFVSTVQDNTYVYQTMVAYTIHDQLGTVLPASVPVNEQWTTAAVNDYAGTNWRQPGAAGDFSDPGVFIDHIYGETTNRRPRPIFDPNSIIAVQHWGQAWRIGSVTIGAGKRVQTDTVQKYLGRASHTGVVSPP